MSLYCKSLEVSIEWFGIEDIPNKLERKPMEVESRENYIQIALQTEGGATSGINRMDT